MGRPLSSPATCRPARPPVGLASEVCSRRGRAEIPPGCVGPHRAGGLLLGTHRLQWTLCGHCRAGCREGHRAPSGGQSWSHTGHLACSQPSYPSIRRNKVRWNIFLNASSRFLWQLENLLIPKYKLLLVPYSFGRRNNVVSAFSHSSFLEQVFSGLQKKNTKITVYGFPRIHLEAPESSPGSQGARAASSGQLGLRLWFWHGSVPKIPRAVVFEGTSLSTEKSSPQQTLSKTATGWKHPSANTDKKTSTHKPPRHATGNPHRKSAHPPGTQEMQLGKDLETPPGTWESATHCGGNASH